MDVLPNIYTTVHIKPRDDWELLKIERVRRYPPCTCAKAFCLHRYPFPPYLKGIVHIVYNPKAFLLLRLLPTLSLCRCAAVML